MNTDKPINTLKEKSACEIGKLIESRNFSSKLFNDLLSNLPMMILTYCKSGYLNDVLDSLDSYKNALYRMAADMSIESNSDLNTAYVLGYLKASFNMLAITKRSFSQELEDKFPLALVDKSSHVKNILAILYDRSVIGHAELSVILSISKSALTNTIRRIEKYNLIDIKKYGRFKYYYLSSKGKNLYKKYSSSVLISEPTYHEFVYRLMDIMTKSIQTCEFDDIKMIELLNREFASLDLARCDLFKSKMKRLSITVQMNELKKSISRNNQTESRTMMTVDCRDIPAENVEYYEFPASRGEQDHFQTNTRYAVR